jgi:hypothetical protein
MSHHRKTLTIALGLGIVFAAVLGTAAPAHAQYQPGYYPPPPPPPPPPRGVYRSGLIFGAGLGVGGISMSDCGNVCGVSGLAELHIGGMIAPRVALMGDFWLGFRTFDDPAIGSGTLYNGIYTLAAQVWLADMLWVKGGLGFGRGTIDADLYSDDESGFAILLAAGVELYQQYNYAVDLQLRYGHVSYDSLANGGFGGTSQYGLMVGFNWY